MTADIAKWLRSVPPIPRVCSVVLEMSQDGDTPLAKIAPVIEGDARMTMQVLRVANSPALARRYPAVTVREAVVTLGAEETARIAIGCALLTELNVSSPLLPLEAVLQHGLTVARAWKPFGDAEATSGVLASAPLLALTHDVPVFTRYATHLEETANWEELHDLERRTWGLTRCEVADQLAEVWRLPAAIRNVLGGWHVCRRRLPRLYESFMEAAVHAELPLLRAFGTR